MLDTSTVEYIKASEGVYRASDVARHYKVHRSTVCRIWQGQIHNGVRPAPDFPDITTPLRAGDLAESVLTLLERGMRVKEVAAELGISERTVYKVRAGKAGVY